MGAARGPDLSRLRGRRLALRQAGRAERTPLRRADGTPVSLTAIIVVIMAAVLIGAFGLRLSRTTSDFYVASRTVTPLWNASAIGGEYLSAASFLGIAGLIMTFGADMLWLPVGWTGGYLVLLALVSAPLRRSGAYTLPDF